MQPFSKAFWLHIAATLGGVLLTAVVPPLQTVVSHHPVVTTILGGIWAALGAIINPKQPAAN